MQSTCLMPPPLDLSPLHSHLHLYPALQRLNFFGGPPLSMEDRVNLSAQEADHLDDRVVVLSNVHLDSAEVLNSLNIMFTGKQQ